MFYYIYILQSKKDKRWYTGFTVDLRKRLQAHNEGKYTSWTKGRGLFDLIYYEACKNEAPPTESAVSSPPSSERPARKRLRVAMAGGNPPKLNMKKMLFHPPVVLRGLFSEGG